MTVTDYRRMFRLDGRTAVVIGAGSGIGRETAQGLAAAGARVVCADRDVRAAESTARLCREQQRPDGQHQDDTLPGPGGDSVRAEELDVTDASAVAGAPERFGHPEILVHTAAMNVRRRILDYTPEEFDAVVGLNLAATFSVLRAFGTSMTRHGRGSMVFLSSIRARVVEPGQGVYGATKAGLESLVRSAASEFSAQGVRVNAVAPGVVTTPLTQQVRDDPDWYRRYAEQSAMGRWAEPGEMVGAAVYLSSPAASYVTGTVLAVDGGWTAVDGAAAPTP
ncbi:SDR family NAD(P)-dependent oxidoreductase [Nocardiopsis nanhaiensis]